MANTPACFELIQSLDKAEKIYFKRYLSYQSGKGEPTVYLKLFNELDKMTSYDIERLNRKFKGENFMKHLPVSLNYLYTLLLNSLVSFHGKKNDKLKANEMLGEVQVLYNRGLYRECTRHIKRSRKFMEEREYYSHLFILGSYEYNLTAKEMKKHELKQLREVTHGRKMYLYQLNNELSIFDLCNQMTEYMREKQLKPNKVFDNEIKELEVQLDDLKEDFTAGTTTFKLFYLTAQKRLYYLKNQPVESLAASHKYIAMRRNIPEILQYSLDTDLTALENHITKSLELWFVEEAAYWLPEIGAIQTQAPDLQFKCKLLTIHFRFHIMLLSGNLDGLSDFVSGFLPQLADMLAPNANYLHAEMYRNLALYYFITGDMQESLTWIEKVFEQKNVDEWIQQRLINTRLIEIMAHFNLENYQLVKSLCRSFERALKKLQSHDNEFVEELNWIKKIRKSEAYFLPRQMKEFSKTLLPEGYFSIPPNYRLVLMSVWGEAHHNKISLRESWTQHTENILTEMKSTAKMESLCFGEMKT